MTAFLLWFMEITPFLRRLTSALLLPGDQMLNTSHPTLMSQRFVLSCLCRSLGLEVRFLCFSWERATVKKYPKQIWDQQNQVPGMTKNWSQGLCVHSTKLRAWSLVCAWQAASEWVSEWRFLGRRCEDKVAMASDPLIANWVLTSHGVENPI